MSNTLLPAKSSDDLSLYQRKQQSDRRTRSCSPVKTRQSLPPNFFDMRLPHHPTTNEEYLNSAGFDKSPQDKAHLIQLSHSPLSKRLHISEANKYVIPIPFTLQLPPKLSQKNIMKELEKARSRSASPVRSKSPEKSSSRSRSRSPHKKQTRLIYTGNGYEKIDSLSDDEVDYEIQDELNQRIALARRPAPPLVKTNAKKNPKQAYQNRFLADDELSIIEEASHSGGSRLSSIKSKGLPPVPSKDVGIPISRGNEISHQTPPKEISTQINQVNPQRDVSPELCKPLPAAYTQLITNSKPVFTNIKLTENPKTHNTLNKESNIRNPNISQERRIPSHDTSNFIIGSIPKPTQEATRQVSNAPITNKDTLLKISKRSFSDESHVSSVSSFSSFGDVFSYSQVPVQFQNPQTLNLKAITVARTPSEQPPSRTVSTASSSGSDASTSSWNSLQKSVDISFNERSDYSFASHKTLKQKTSNTESATDTNSENEWEDEEESPRTDIGDLSEPSASCMSSDDEETLPLNLSRGSTLFEVSKFLPKRYKKAIEERVESTEEKKDMNQNELPIDDMRMGVAETRSIDSEKREIDNSENSQIDNSENSQIENYEEGQFHNSLIRKISDSETSKVSDSENEGEGKRFSFPNSIANVTNNDVLRQQLRSGNSLKSSRSRFGYGSISNGQIEIPDLNDKAMSEAYSSSKSYSSYNGTTFDDIQSQSSASTLDADSSKLEPIGFPGKAAQNVVREQYRMMHNDNADSDSDFESSKFSLYASSTKSKSTPCLNINKALPPVKEALKPTNKSPVRHARHRSMYSIDFNVNDFEAQPPLPVKHQKSLSSDFKKLTEKPQPSVKQPPVKQPPTKQTTLPNQMVISVAEPPTQVSYEVDFKEALSTPEDEFDNTSIFNDYQQSPSMISNKDFRKMSNNMNDLNLVNNMKNLNLAVNKKDLHTDGTSASSKSSYQTSRSSVAESTTSLSDTESVMIDLTKENYDICMVNRVNSTLSYKSVTEKTKEGKEVEVVLVDEVEDDDEEDDDLLSIYSKYRNNSWLLRTQSTTSSSSNRSAASFVSNASQTQLRLKPSPGVISRSQSTFSPGVISRSQNTFSPGEDLNLKRFNGSTKSNCSATYQSRRIKPPSNLLKSPEKAPDSTEKNQSQRNLQKSDSDLWKNSNKVTHSTENIKHPDNLKTTEIPTTKSPEFNEIYRTPFQKPESRPTFSSSNKRHTIPLMDSNYFDYTSGDKYDFKSFMQQRAETIDY